MSLLEPYLKMPNTLKKVRAKKHLGQHFLTNHSIAEAITEAFNEDAFFEHALEIGPGMGILTQYLSKRPDIKLQVIDIDKESTQYLEEQKWLESNQIILGDFLKIDLNTLFNGSLFGIIGNFPYNISTQILFKILDHKDQVIELVGMFQKEVAERIASKSGSKIYGITSVLLQAFFDIEYLFTVEATEFSPPPKVKSAVIRLKRNEVKKLSCDEKLFKSIVKSSFNQRRKTLRNSLKPFLDDSIRKEKVFDLRPEQLDIGQFIELTSLIRRIAKKA